MRPMSFSELIVMLSTLRLGGVEANLRADTLLDADVAARPEGFARAIAGAAGKRPEMVRLVKAAQLNKIVAEHARSRVANKTEVNDV